MNNDKNILFEIAKRTKERIKTEKEKLPLDSIIKKAAEINADTGFPFEKALAKNDISFICEVKKASPSKGIICEDFDYVKIADKYEKSGADAISVLTEPHYFMGKDKYLADISEKVKIPLLRKDFIVDEYMIYEAKLLGAAAVLLITSILDEKQLTEYIKTADTLGLSALVETHDEQEIETALRAGARIIGVNNRDLKTFKVDINLSAKLRSLAPNDRIFVSESGIKTADDVKKLCEMGVNAVLIGETLMKSADISKELKKLKGGE